MTDLFLPKGMPQLSGKPARTGGEWILAAGLAFAWSNLTACAAHEWFISPGGNDHNSGMTEAAAFQTWGKANATLIPGDTLTVLDGSYGTGRITVSGTANAWITVRAKHPGVPEISLAIAVNQASSPDQYASPGYKWLWEQDCFDLAAVAYVKIIGLNCVGFNPLHQIVSSGHGINIQGCHHVLIKQCRVSGCSGNGIAGSPQYRTKGNLMTGPLDFITIEDNEVSDCGFWNQYQCSGISLWEANDAGLGRDSSGYNLIIRRNICRGNENKIGQNGQTVDKATDGEGIIIDTFNANHYPHATLVEGNLAYDNGGRGIEAVNSHNVTLRYNTLYHNNRNKLQGTWRQGEIENDGGTNFLAENNICACGTNTAWRAALVIHSFGAPVTAALNDNLLFGPANFVPREVDAFPQAVLTETNTLTCDPRFVLGSVNSTNADFRLQAGSPAIQSANGSPAPRPDLAGNLTPQGQPHNRGAYQ